MVHPAVADPPLSREDIIEQSREKVHWAFAYAVSSKEFRAKEKAHNPEAYKTMEGISKLLQLWADYKQEVLDATGLPRLSWTPYILPDGKRTSLLVLGVGFSKVLHCPLRPNVIEKAKKILGRDDEPQWYLLDGRGCY